MKVPLHILLTLIVLLLLGVQLFPAAPVPQDDERRFKGAIRRDGWEIPGLQGSYLVSRKRWLWGEDGAKTAIFLSILRPKGRSLLLDECAHYYSQYAGVYASHPRMGKTVCTYRHATQQFVVPER
jgi:hypothetical protein